MDVSFDNNNSSISRYSDVCFAVDWLKVSTKSHLLVGIVYLYVFFSGYLYIYYTIRTKTEDFPPDCYYKVTVALFFKYPPPDTPTNDASDHSNDVSSERSI